MHLSSAVLNSRSLSFPGFVLLSSDVVDNGLLCLILSAFESSIVISLCSILLGISCVTVFMCSGVFGISVSASLVRSSVGGCVFGFVCGLVSFEFALFGHC